MLLTLQRTSVTTTTSTLPSGITPISSPEECRMSICLKLLWEWSFWNIEIVVVDHIWWIVDTVVLAISQWQSDTLDCNYMLFLLCTGKEGRSLDVMYVNCFSSESISLHPIVGCKACMTFFKYWFSLIFLPSYDMISCNKRTWFDKNTGYFHWCCWDILHNKCDALSPNGNFVFSPTCLNR